jgi:hypothetical protein
VHDAGGLPRWRTIVAEAISVAALTLAAVAVHLQLWRAAWREPWVRGGDADFYLMVARSLGQHGSYLHDPNLGWPFGQSLADLPEGGDNLHLLALRFLAFVTRGPAAAVNIFYLATFAAVALTSHLVLRRLGMSRLGSALGAFVYAFAPYHFLRGEGHLLLSGYEMIPIGVLIALAVWNDPLPLLRSDGKRGIDLRSRRTWLLIVATIALASTGPYYFVFSMMLIAITAAFHAMNKASWRPVAAAALLIAVGVMAFAVNVSPSLLMNLGHGRNAAVGQRSPFETELYGLKISQLFVPREGHRIDVLRRLSDRTQGTEPHYQSESGQQLGLIGAVSLAGLLIAGGRQLAGRRRAPPPDDGRSVLLGRLVVMTVACLLIGTVGGISFLVSAGGLRQIRAWNRISIVVAWLTVMAMVIAFDRGNAWTRGRWGQRPALLRWAPPLGASLIAAIAFVDQGGHDAPAYAQIHAQYASDSAFFASVRARLDAGAAVFNLPYQAFPETSPRAQMGAYDEAAGYLYEPTLKWSFGFMRGRQPDYPLMLEQQPAEQWMTAVAAVGFTGIVIDRNGYSNEQRVQEESQITELTGAPIVSADGHYSFYDLRNYATTALDELGVAGVKARAAATLALGSQSPAP